MLNAMKQSRIVYASQYTPSPVSFWVHRPLDAEIWSHARAFDPPLPQPVPGKGWARLEVELDGVHLSFASMAEVLHVIEVLARNPLPTTRQLSSDRGTTVGPNTHWLSRLPAKAKPLRFRRKLVQYLREVGREYAHVA